MEYNLKCNEEHLKIINKSLDLFSRVLMGQLDEVALVFRFENINNDNFDFNKINNLSNEFRNLKINIGLSPNSCYGIHNNEFVSDSSRKSYDILQVIRHKLAWDRVDKDPKKDDRDFKSMFGVSFDEPYKSSNDDKFKLPILENNKNAN
jgi:hypothetical protein